MKSNSLKTSEAERVERARSASERFLFYRLETLPQTKGLFRLNVELDIPFDGWGQDHALSVRLWIVSPVLRAYQPQKQ